MSLFGGKRGGESEGSEPGSGPGIDRSVQGEPAERAGASGGRSEGSGFLRRSPRASGGHEVANIGKSIIIKGDLSGGEDLEIDGKVDGRVQLENHQVTIGAHGQVNAEVTAKAVVVVGHVVGNVIASERVEVQATGVIEGDIRAPKLLIQEGAVVNGAIGMTKEGATNDDVAEFSKYQQKETQTLRLKKK